MIDDARIDAIVQQVMAELRQGERVRHGPLPEPTVAAQPPPPAPALRHGDNLFPDVDSAIAAAHRAYRQLFDLPLSVREQMIAHIRRVMRENAQLLAYEAWQETEMGRYEDKIEKNLLNANKAPGTEILTPTAWSGDGGLTLVEYQRYRDGGGGQWRRL
jgi:cation transport regulator ChaB